MPYVKFNEDTHVIGSYEELPINSLKIKDNVVLIEKTFGNQIDSLNSQFLEIQHDKLFKFQNNSNTQKIHTINQAYFSASTGRGDAYPETMVFFNLNGKLIYLYKENQSSTYDNPFTIDFFDNFYNEYFLKNDQKIITRIFKTTHSKKNGKEGIDINCYMTLPVNEKCVLVFLRQCDGYPNDYIAVIKKPEIPEVQGKGKKAKEQHRMNLQMYFWNNCKAYCRNLDHLSPTLFQEINCEDSNFFKSIIWATSYNLRQHVENENRKDSLKSAKEIWAQIGYENKVNYEPVFEIDKLKVYRHNSDIYFTLKDKFLNYTDGPVPTFEDKDYSYIYNYQRKYIVELPKELKNKKLQANYRIGYAIADFEYNQRGINPRTGDFYLGNRIDNSHIKYQDEEGMEVREDVRRSEFYIKINGYYVKANNKEGEDIKHRIDVMNKLAENN